MYPTNYLQMTVKAGRMGSEMSEMSENGDGPDRSSYIVLIHGLFLNGKLEEAYKYYMEMKEKQFLPEPKTEEMLQAWISSKETADVQRIGLKDNRLDHGMSGKKTQVTCKSVDLGGDFQQQPRDPKSEKREGLLFLGIVYEYDSGNSMIFSSSRCMQDSIQVHKIFCNHLVC